jgi:F-type H+-transporting ATPase subunit delta
MNENSVKNCAKVLLSLELPHQDIEKTRDIWQSCAELRAALCCPAVGRDEKYRVTDRAFPESVAAFLKVMEKYGHIGALSEIIDTYEKLRLEQLEFGSATLYCAAQPDSGTVARFEQAVCKKLGCKSAKLEVVIDPSLIGGYVLQIADTVYDKSVKNAVKTLQKELAHK